MIGLILKYLILIAVITKILLTAPLAIAEDSTLLSQIESKLGKKVDAVNSTDFADVYEVISEGKIVYINKNLSHVFSGYVYDIDKRINITARRLKVAQRIKPEDLPLADSIQTVRGKGRKTIVVFSDPNCQYCRKLEEELSKLDDIKVATFLYPVLSDESASLSRDIWCSSDRSASWTDWMALKTRPKENFCSSPNERNLLLGKRLNINATPVIFFPDGDRITGMTSASNIQQKLNNSENLTTSSKLN